MANKVELKTLVEKMNLKNLTPDVDLSDKDVEIPDINRPALQLTGFFEHFDSERVQIIGYVEYTFLEKMTDEDKKKRIYETLLSYKIPCLIFCRKYPCIPDREEDIGIYSRDHPMAECGTCTMHFYSWCAG